VAGLPDIIISLCQIQYASPVTSQWKWMPVIVQIMRKRGYDGVLYESFWKVGDKGIVKMIRVCIIDSHAATLINQ